MGRVLRGVRIAAVFVCATSAFAVTRTVTNLNDSGTGSLRAQLAAAANGDTINFSVTGTIGLTSGELLINKNLTISGPGANLLTISRASGASAFRLCHVANGTGIGPTVTILGLTFANGSAPGSTTSGDGGAIENEYGTLTIYSCAFSNNVAGHFGGAINNFASDSTPGDASLALHSCTFDSNQAGSSGGALANACLGQLSEFNANAELVLDNCTFASNHASLGGAIDNLANQPAHAAVHVTSATFYLNSATGSGQALLNQANGVMTTTNSVFVGNGARNIVNQGVSFVSGGYNLCDDAGGGVLTASGDRINTAPLLDPAGLQYNGGSTRTIAPVVGSPAIDQGNSFGLTSDQRGQPRPNDIASIPNANGGDGSDIGAYEGDPVQVSPLTVTSTSDANDGFCGMSDCSLREAVARANLLPGNDTITFAPNVTGTVQFHNADVPIAVNDSVTITGPGARLLAINAFTQTRVFEFNAGTSTVSGLTITGGFVGAPSGSGGSASAGGILNFATLTLNDCMISNNVAVAAFTTVNAQPGGTGKGGGILNQGALVLNRCTFSANQVAGGAGAANANQFGAGGQGGNGLGSAIFNDTNAALLATNCTFFNNAAGGGAGGNGPLGANGGEGAGTIYNQGMMTLLANTVSGNSGVGGAGGKGSVPQNNGVSGAGHGGLVAAAGTSNVGDSIVAANGASGFGRSFDVDGAFTSNGFNLIGTADNSSGFGATGDQLGSDAAKLNPLFDPNGLRDNGGTTDTVALLSGSPAINTGDNANGPALDQRSYTRDNARDIGAFEFRATPPVPPDWFISAVSEKSHNNAGAFDIVLPFAGNVGVESRSADANGQHTIIFTFANPITSVANAVVTEGSGSVVSRAISADRHKVMVNISGASDAQRIVLSLEGVLDDSGNRSASSAVRIGLLLGDANGDGVVNSADATIARNASGQNANATNFRADFNLDGTINSGDATIARNRSGQSINASSTPIRVRELAR